jgi:hypothetical protein
MAIEPKRNKRNMLVEISKSLCSWFRSVLEPLAAMILYKIKDSTPQLMDQSICKTYDHRASIIHRETAVRGGNCANIQHTAKSSQRDFLTHITATSKLTSLPTSKT